MARWFDIRRVDSAARTAAVAEALSEAGLPSARKLAEPFERLLQDSTFAARAEDAVGLLGDTTDPARALGALEEVRTRLRELGQPPGRLWLPLPMKLAFTLAGSSPWAGRVLARDPEALFDLADTVEAGRLGREPPPSPRPWLRAASGDDARLERILRRARNRHMLHVALAELWDRDVRRTSRSMSELADACIEAAFCHHRERVLAKYGPLDPPCRAAVIGMGKLGGRELNFSSDVDLIYVYEHDEGGAGELNPHQLHVKLFEGLSSTLSRLTGDGFVFRVDLDLRPEGRRGVLANSLAGLERYYEAWGRTWERAAWIRARPVAGDLDLGEEVIEMLRPFVFRRSMDLSQVEALVKMKADIDRAERRTQRAGTVDVKLGRGGIREVEFFVQAHQLLYGGRQVELRRRGTLDALEGLVATGHVSAQVRDDLDAAYRWLRRLEHRVQLRDDQQTHRLPSDPDGLSWLAHTFGLSIEALQSHTRQHTDRVSELFENLLGRVDDVDPLPDPLETVMDPSVPETDRLEAAHRLGAMRPDAALVSVDRCQRMPGTGLFEPGDTVGPRLLLDCFESPIPDRALVHLPDFLQQLRRHQTYRAQLERPDLRRGVARLLGTSDLLAQILVTDPRLLRLVLLQASLPGPDRMAELLREAVDWDGDPETRLIQMRRFKQQELLRTAVFDLAGALSLEDVEVRLTQLAECIIEACLNLALRQMVERYGEPPAECTLALLGAGALGASEMTYRTDVDLAAIHLGSGETSGGSRGSTSVTELWTKVVQRFVSYLTLPMAGGDLYPVDMRLRPSGNQGTLLTSLPAFREYHRRSAQLWERQALVRTRPISTGAAAEVSAAIEEAAYDGPPPRRHEVHAMKERLAAEHRRGPRPDAELKYGPGGILELQFMLQYLQLREGRNDPRLRTPRPREALRRLADAGILEPRSADALRAAYDRLRREQNLVRLLQDEVVHRHATRSSGPDQISLDEAREQIRRSYSRVMGRH